MVFHVKHKIFIDNTPVFMQKSVIFDYCLKHTSQPIEVRHAMGAGRLVMSAAVGDIRYGRRIFSPSFPRKAPAHPSGAFAFPGAA